MGLKIKGKGRLIVGGYAALLTAGVIAMVALVNVAAGAIETALGWRADITQNKVYSLSEATEQLVGDLDKNVYIYTMYQIGNENAIVMNLLRRYASLSDNVIVENFDPVRDAARARELETLTYGVPQREWIVVTNTNTNTEGKRIRIIRAQDMLSMNEQGKPDQIFIEQLVTGAIQYVTNPNVQRVSFLQGHGEPSPASMVEFIRQLDAVGFEVRGYNTTQANQEPLGANDVLMIIGPETDCSREEYDTLRAFMREGGRVVMAMTPWSRNNSATLTNFESLLSVYGGDISLQHKVVYESADANYYGEQTTLRPWRQPSQDALDVMGGTELDLGSARRPIYMYYSQPISAVLGQNLSTKVIPMLYSSKTAYTMDAQGTRSDDGQFLIALAAVYTPQENVEGRMVLFGSSYAFTDLAGRGISAENNNTLLTAAVVWCAPQLDDVLYIPAKSYSDPILALPAESTLRALQILVCIVIPAAVLGTGLGIFLYRRHK